MLKYFKPIIPPIFYPSIFKEYFVALFYQKQRKKIFEFKETFFKRHAFVNCAISKFDKPKYLEIGVHDNDLFNSIPLKTDDKYGVDPVSGGNYRMKSDEFFNQFNDLKFDVCFIDGLHHYDQCKRDIINSINSLNKNGIILIHDLLPRSELEEKTPRMQGTWTGDIWKVAVELSSSKNCSFKIINNDCGIGVLKIKDGFEFNHINDLKNQKYADYVKYFEDFPIIEPEEALNFIKN